MEFSPSPQTPHPGSCLILGGGMTGLIAGTVLQHNGVSVTILDKGRGIGGRLATRRIRHPHYGEGVFDYGAQFFTVSDPRFQAWVDQWLQQGIVGEWSGPFSPKYPCYHGFPSNRGIAQHLGKDLTLHTQTRVVTVAWTASHWTVHTENGMEFQGDRLIITAPVPQTLELLDRSAIALSPSLRQSLEAITYERCIAVLALLDQPSQIPEPGGLQLNDTSLSWIACNQKKGISPQGSAVTLHATPEFSQLHWDAEPPLVAEKLFKIASPYLRATIVDYQIHRWRYSRPQTVYGASHLTIQTPGLLILAGDAFSSTVPKEPALTLESAVLSGLEASKALLI